MLGEHPVWHKKFSSGSSSHLNSAATHSSFELLSTGPEQCKVFTTLATVPIDTPAGDKGFYIPLLEQHLARLLENAKEAKLWQEHLLEHKTDWIRSKARKTCFNYLSAYYPERAILRLVLSDLGCEIYLASLTEKWMPSSKISLRSLPATRTKPHLKSTLLETSKKAAKLAKEAGDKHALLLTDEKLVQECDWANIFWFDSSDKLCGSRLNSLPGVTQATLANALEISWQEISLKTLIKDCHTVFISKSTSGLEAVGAIDGEKIRFKAPLFDKTSQQFLAHLENHLTLIL